MKYWTIKIGVSDTWIEDGFDFSPEHCESLGGDMLPYSTPDEVSVEVLSAPDPKVIKKLQGYEV